jgi:hypothetical protein
LSSFYACWLDSEDGEGVVVVVEVAAGMGDVGAAREAEGVDRQVAEAGEGSRTALADAA